MRWWLAAFTVASLIVVPTAGAKQLTKVVAVGADGSTVLQGLTWSALRPSAWTTYAPVPVGRFVLVYPVMERDLPAEPGRYYPAEHTVCYSWDRAVAGECFGASEALENALAGISVLAEPPAILTRLVISGRLGSVRTNGGVAIELAFNRPDAARTMAKRPKKNCRKVRATWTGPDASHRPSLFWACKKGLWATGKLYPTGPLLF